VNKIKTTVYAMDVGFLQQPDQLDKHLKRVSSERREKIRGLHSQAARALSAGAEMLLQQAVLKSFGIAAPLQLTKGEQGKPALAKYPAIHFNLSHSGHYVVCALSQGPVGVDIEQRERLKVEIARRFFNEAEVAWLLSLPAAEQQRRLCDLWSIKESYMKYTGRGFGLPMHAFAVQITGDAAEAPEVAVFEDDRRMAVFIKDYQGPENYAMWCCSGLDQFEEGIEWIRLEETDD
jgi:4'-phosphopantetheinyl transferase